MKNLGEYHDQPDFALQYPARDVRDQQREVVLDLRRGRFIPGIDIEERPSVSANLMPANTRSNTAAPMMPAMQAWIA